MRKNSIKSDNQDSDDENSKNDFEIIQNDEDVGESSTMLSLNNYSNIVKSICNSSGLFRNRYKQAESQIVNMNRIIEQIYYSAIPAIKNDIYNITMKNIDWNNYKNRLKTDLKKSIPVDNVFYLKQFEYDIDEDVPQISTDYINNMNLAIYNLGITDSTKVEELSLKQKKKINNFIEIRDDLYNEIDNSISELKEYENNISTCRKRNLEILKDNLEILYHAHLKHVDNKMKKKLEHVRVYYGKKEILLQDSQKEFISNSIKIMLK